MKKLAFLLSVLCLLGLTACTKAEDPNNLFELPEGVTPTEALPQEKDAEPPKDTAYAYGNLQKNGECVNYQGRILFSHLRMSGPDATSTGSSGKFQLYYMDKDTYEVSPFCTDAGCTHITYVTDKCAADYVLGTLEQYEGKLYADASDWNWYVAEYKNGKFRQMFDGDIRGFVHGNGNLYARTADGSLLVLPEGSKKPKILVDEYNFTPCAVFGNYLYGNNGLDIARLDLEAENPQAEVILSNVSGVIDGTYIYYVSGLDRSLYRCSLDGSNPELMLQEPVLAASLNFDEDYLYYRLYEEDLFGSEESCNLYRLPKDGSAGPEKITTLPMSSYTTIYTIPGYDKLFVIVRPDGDKEDEIYLVPKAGGSPIHLELPDV